MLLNAHWPKAPTDGGSWVAPELPRGVTWPSVGGAVGSAILWSADIHLAQRLANQQGSDQSMLNTTSQRTMVPTMATREGIPTVQTDFATPLTWLRQYENENQATTANQPKYRNAEAPARRRNRMRCAVMITLWPNIPAQASRAKDFRFQIAPQSRRCLEPDCSPVRRLALCLEVARSVLSVSSIFTWITSPTRRGATDFQLT